MTGYLHALVEDAAREAGCTVAQILGDQRTRRVVSARWRIARLAYDGGYTSGQIARALNRDPSTIVHALKAKDRPWANTGKCRPQYPSYPQADHRGEAQESHV